MSEYKAKLNPFTGQLQLVSTNVVLAFKAAVATQASLPLVSNSKGDARIANDTGVLWVWNIDAATGLLTDWVSAGDIVDIDWSVITNKPSSSVADIDSAVSLKHATTVQFNKATAAEISALTDKATPADADVILGEDSAHATVFSKIKITWANIKATLKSYFDTLYELAGAVSSHASLTTGVHGVGAGTIAKVADIATDSNLSVAAQDAITKRHTQGTDLGLDTGGTNPVTAATIKGHVESTSNPHSVTKAQVGLTNADDTSDANKPVSTAQDTAIKEIKHIEVMIDGNGFVITDGVKTPYKFVPFACTISGWDVLASNSDSFTVDILYNATFSSAPASITGVGTKPNVTAAASGSGTDLTNWTATTLAKGGILAFQVAGAPAAATWAVLRIRVS